MKESGYTKARDEQPTEHGSGSDTPCRVCGTPTAHGTLRDYGGRCFPCFQAYGRTTPKRDPRMAGVIADAGEGPLAWARRIVLRAERAVDPPSAMAVATAREALKARALRETHGDAA